MRNKWELQNEKFLSTVGYDPTPITFRLLFGRLTLIVMGSDLTALYGIVNEV